MVSALEAAVAVMEAAGTALSADEITRRMIDSGAWKSEGKTPAATVESRLAVNYKIGGEESLVVRVAPGTYALRKLAGAVEMAQKVKVKAEGTMTYLDADEKVLGEDPTHQPLHYHEITK